ncbi:NAD+ synthase [Kiritimatiellaeota bacterium B1221]|nr:NAD+ synthase [Kiritimatiellaeota bacterium B1221]
MKSIRIALAQVNCTVGALAQNRSKILSQAVAAEKGGSDLVLFPELALCGYPPEDLVLKPHFIDAIEKELAILCEELPPELVCVVGMPRAGKARPQNAAAVIHQGKVIASYTKQQLPNYGVFDEQRIFEAGNRPLCLQMGEARLGLHICEDSWIHSEENLRHLADMELTALLNLSASPFHREKCSVRQAVLQKTSNTVKAPLVYCNLVGGQDELVFDGGSLVISPRGEILCQGARFKDDLVYVDLPCAPAKQGTEFANIVKLPPRERATKAPKLPPSTKHRSMDELEEVYEALTLGLRDYANKNGFQDILVAISGGIDSALVAAIAVDAVGADRVSGISLPTQYSSAGTRSDALQLAGNLGIKMPMVPIQHLFDAYTDLLEPQWPGRGPDVTEENLQARIRGTIVMALSNKFGSLVVATGNKSEMATGYATLYGDMCGGYALIKDVPKTMVFDLCRWSNIRQGSERIPQTLIDRPPSAELRADQKDSDSLPPYEILDGILSLYIEQDKGRDEIVAEGFDPHMVTRIIRLVDGNEYKRRQAPPGVKITPKAFGRDRRVPITNHFRPTPPSNPIPHD